MSFMEAEIRSYLEKLVPTGEELRRLVAGTGPDGVHPNRGWVYDAELGFVHAPSVLSGTGVNGTSTFYDYEEDGARKTHQLHRPPVPGPHLRRQLHSLRSGERRRNVAGVPGCPPAGADT